MGRHIRLMDLDCDIGRPCEEARPGSRHQACRATLPETVETRREGEGDGRLDGMFCAYLVHRDSSHVPSREAPLRRSSRSREAAARTQERRDREDSATRLLALVPSLASLRLELTEVLGEERRGLSQYAKIILVDRAPALFVFRCGDGDCDGRPHDLTRVIMDALSEREERFAGESVCHGFVHNAPCRRRLRYHALATYRDVSASDES